MLASAWAVTSAIDVGLCFLIGRVVFGRHPAVPVLVLISMVANAIGLAIIAAMDPPSTPYWVVGCIVVAICAGFAMWLRRRRFRSFWPYLLGPGVLCWAGLYLAGVHPGARAGAGRAVHAARPPRSGSPRRITLDRPHDALAFRARVRPVDSAGAVPVWTRQRGCPAARHRAGHVGAADRDAGRPADRCLCRRDRRRAHRASSDGAHRPARAGRDRHHRVNGSDDGLVLRERGDGHRIRCSCRCAWARF